MKLILLVKVSWSFLRIIFVYNLQFKSLLRHSWTQVKKFCTEISSGVKKRRTKVIKLINNRNGSLKVFFTLSPSFDILRSYNSYLTYYQYLTYVIFILAPMKKRGRPSSHTKYPELVLCVKSFIEQNSAEAHLRRRTDTMYNNGVTLQQIANHVKSTLGITISRHTVHRLMQPPRKKTIASKLYKCLVNLFSLVLEPL